MAKSRGDHTKSEAAIEAASLRLVLGLVFRVIGRIDVGHGPRPDSMKLENRVLAEPSEMVGAGLHDRDAARSKRLALAGIERVSEPHIDDAGHHGHMLRR